VCFFGLQSWIILGNLTKDVVCDATYLYRAAKVSQHVLFRSTVIMVCIQQISTDHRDYDFHLPHRIRDVAFPVDRIHD
jgi:hypothetical protein